MPTSPNAPYDEFDAIAGLIVPDIIVEQDGFYSHEIVIESLPTQLLSEASTMPLQVLPTRTVALAQPVPRYRKSLIWRNAL